MNDTILNAEIERQQKLKAVVEFHAQGILDTEVSALYEGGPSVLLRNLWENKTQNIVKLHPNSPLIDVALQSFVMSVLALSPKRINRRLVLNEYTPFIRADVRTLEIDGGGIRCLVRVVHQDKIWHDQLARETIPLRDRVPSIRWWEMQHAMIAAEVDETLFVSFTGGDTRHFNYVSVKPDRVFQSNHVAECIQFWDYVRRGVCPPNAAPMEPLETNGPEEMESCL